MTSYVVVIDEGMAEHQLPLDFFRQRGELRQLLLAEIGASADSVVENTESVVMDDAALRRLDRPTTLRVRLPFVNVAYSTAKWSWCVSEAGSAQLTY